MLLPFLGSLLIFVGVTLGLAWPLAARLKLAPAERLVASVALSLLGVYLFAWAVHVCAGPTAVFWLLPAFAGTGLIVGARALRELWRDAVARAILLAQLLVAAWCLGWMALIQSYSGGGWAGDWFEHWERTRFFLEHWPLDRMFLLIYPLPARPPLVNVVTGAFLRVTRADYADYQLVSTLLASLVFFPAALLTQRFCARRVFHSPALPPVPAAAASGASLHAIAVLALLFMVSPLFVENATFAWTKLPAAFFALAALVFFLRAHDADAPRAASPLCGALLAAGLLAHYSVGPYAVALGGAWLGLGWARRREAAWWRATALSVLLGALVLASWFGWSLSAYGLHDTLFTNSSATARDVHEGNQFVRIALNLWDTLVPHFLRTFDTSLIAQRSPWGLSRDWFFQCYQINLLFAFGSVAWLAIGRELFRAARPPRAVAFWVWFVAVVVFLGVATHGARDHWGLAHICLQGLVLLGLAFLAARWSELGRGWRLALIAGAAADFTLGIALQFGIQSYAFDRWLAAGQPADESLRSYSEPAFKNLAGKIVNHLDFFSDTFAPPAALVLGLLAAIFTLALLRTRAPR
jgi:hypothetical protein